MNTLSRITVSLLVLAGLAGSAVAATTILGWPTTSTVEIGSGARALYSALEPSGLVWHSGRNQLMLVGDEGQVIAMDDDGSNASLWTVSGDLEDITVVDPTSNYVYLADEDGSIKKYNLSTRAVTQTWSVTTWMPELTCPSGSGTCGMEALTYADGYFYAGYQYNGKIFKLDLSGTTAVKKAEYTGYSASSTDISGLTYKDGYLYALYSDTLVIMDLSGNIKTAYNVPNSDQEGVAIGEDSNDDGDANIFIGEDGSKKIYSYDNFPIYGWTAPVVVTDPDTDGDGVVDSLDCSDSDASVHTMATFYTDADSDGLGSDAAASFCAVSAPAGYSSNSNDSNDSIPNAGVEISEDGVDNDGDGKTDEANLGSEGLHPYYGALNANVNSVGKITGFWGLQYGQVGVRYADGSVYRYRPFSVSTRTVATVKAIYGTAYFTVTLNGSTVYMNGYTGAVGSYTPNTRTEIYNDGVDNDLDGLVDEHSTTLSNGLHPNYGVLDPATSAKNKIVGFWGLKNGAIGVRYADGSVYRYEAFDVQSETFSTVTQVPGTAYLTVTLNGSSVTINGYNGTVR
ncbi:MAG: hypothetical protein AAB383_02660 [Patescibacteria group bacterium]